MAGSRNLASKYSPKVDERFSRESLVSVALNNDYKFTGVKTVNVYSIPTVPMTDYKRSGANRYGTPNDLSRNVQTLTVNNDKAFTFIIDKGDQVQSEYVMDAGKALARELREVWVPLYDTYVLHTMAAAASANGAYSAKAITKNNAYEEFLAGMEWLGDHNVPEEGRVAFCSYKFANYLKQDSAFMKTAESSQRMTIKGLLGEVDGCKIVKVPSSRMPAGAAFILCHPDATTAPRQLEEYKTHDNPPGINGWLVEGRVVYDCFVLDGKINAIYFHGAQKALKVLNFETASVLENSAQTQIVIRTPLDEGHTWKYKAYQDSDPEPYPAYDADLALWTAVTQNEKIAAAGNNRIMVAEVDSSNKAKGVGVAKINTVSE